MTTIGPYEFPDDLRYAKEHVWAKAEGTAVTIGITQLGQALAGDIVYVEIPRLGRQVTKDEPFMAMESGKWVGRVKSPVSGTISSVNEDIEWGSAVVNQDPYGHGWLARIEAQNLGELDELMNADSAELAAYVASERAKYGK